MYVTLRNTYGNVDFNTASYEQFKGLVSSGQKIEAIKLIRTMLPSWGLKECKDFVEACFFPPQPPTVPNPNTDATKVMLSEIMDDLRSILVTDEQYRNSLTLDLYGRICEERGKLRK